MNVGVHLFPFFSRFFRLFIVMRRIVLDTNCLLQVLPTHSPYHKIWNDVLLGKICLCVNMEIIVSFAL